MHLTPTGRDHLELFLAAELARRRLARGLLLNAPEATALVADAVVEAARDGVRHAEAVAAGQKMLDRSFLMAGVAEVVGDVCVEATFDDGTRLVIVPNPFGAAAVSSTSSKVDSVAVGKLPPGTVVRGSDRVQAARDAVLDRPDIVRTRVLNAGAVPISVTSHYHFFEVNRMLQFDRTAAYGRRLALPGGATMRFDPGEASEVALVPIGGNRIVVGFSGFVDGALDDPEVQRRAMARARAAGVLGPDSEGMVSALQSDVPGDPT